jgi:hypothetical protein
VNSIVRFITQVRKYQKIDYLDVADSDCELSFVSFKKADLKLIFGYVQNHHSYLDSATPLF